jgi:hypothetical protein
MRLFLIEGAKNSDGVVILDSKFHYKQLNLHNMLATFRKRSLEDKLNYVLQNEEICFEFKVRDCLSPDA